MYLFVFVQLLKTQNTVVTDRRCSHCGGSSTAMSEEVGEGVAAVSAALYGVHLH